MTDFTIEKLHEGKRVTHWRCSRGIAGEPVTVRMGEHGVYCCLTCLRIDCEHCVAVQAYDRAIEPAPVEEGAA